MKLLCAPDTFEFPDDDDALQVVLYGQPRHLDRGSAGEAAKAEILRQKLDAASRAWDFLSIALSVVTADLAGLRSTSPDGWTREFELDIAVSDPVFWSTQAAAVESALAFLTTDRWRLNFMEGGMLPAPPREPVRPDEDCVVLLSGGLDSLIGVIDRVDDGKKPLAVSQLVTGDSDKQLDFARSVGGGLRHLQLNHNAYIPSLREGSTRARSFVFLAFGALAATTLARYHDGDEVTLYICENGFIAMNPPLTGARIGSLSTRTAHPAFLGQIQNILEAAGLRVRIENPYSLKTKGEMMTECKDQTLLEEKAVSSTSCGRFARKYKHCGRCVPCQVRRAAFLAWKKPDTTPYVYEDIGRDSSDYAGFDDIRSAAMAIATVNNGGLETWSGATLTSPYIDDVPGMKDLLKRGLEEIEELHKAYGVK